MENRRYTKDRQEAFAALDLGTIDEPILDIVTGFLEVPHCFTLQCCYGHFICDPEQQDPHNFDPIQRDFSGLVRYRIAYFAFCIENSQRGRALWESLARVPLVDPDFVQFGSANWFWERWVNTYALQVEPATHQLKDEALLEPAEALHTEKVRDLFFGEIREVLAEELRAED